MTGTAARLRQVGLPHARARAGAAVLTSAGVAFGLAAAGLRLAPSVAGVFGSWLAIAAVAGLAVWVARRVQREAVSWPSAPIMAATS